MPKAKGAHMPFPNVGSAFETFLEPTRIFLFGKRFPTLVYDPTPMIGGTDEYPDREFEALNVPEEGAELPMPPGRVEQALRQAEAEGIFARIYGFSYEGHYYKMPRPLLFLVRGEGQARVPEEPGEGYRQFNTRFVGVEARDWQFGNDIRVWAVDRHDIAVRLDLEIGTYNKVLLQSLAGREEGAFRGRAYSQSAANFQSMMLGPHQEH
jgi:hypothetical protein